MFKNIFATLFILVSGSVFAECATSPYWFNTFIERINDNFCLSLSHAAGAKKTIMVNSGEGYGTDESTDENYLGFKRIWLEIYDWNGDNVADSISLSNYIHKEYSFDDEGPYRGGVEEISFYQGPENLRHKLSTHGDHLRGLEGINIPANEQGTCHYDGSFNGYKFKAISDQAVMELFSLADALLTHDVDHHGLFAPLFESSIVKIMNKKVLDYPSEWRVFN